MPVLSWSFSGGRDRPRRAETPRVRQMPSSSTVSNLAEDRARRSEDYLAQARHVHRLLRVKLSPTASTLRANPYPEVTDPICRFPLPTFIHRLEAVHLGDLMRISVRTGANVQQRNPPTGFSRASRERPRTPQKRGALRDSLFTAKSVTLSPRDGIPGSRSLKQKRKLFPGFSAASPVCFALPRP